MGNGGNGFQCLTLKKSISRLVWSLWGAEHLPWVLLSGCRASPLGASPTSPSQAVLNPGAVAVASPLLFLPSQLCSAFTAEQATYNHVKIHHGYTNVIGLGDSSTWKLPFLNRYIYMFIAPLAVPIITPLVALGTWPNCLGTGCWVW